MPARLRPRAGGRLRLAAAVLGALLVAAGLGCGAGDRPVTVRGKVTFQGRPVTEGTVQFNDARTGRGAEVELRPDGSYTATLPPGEYAVVILPPLVVVARRETPADVQFKKVGNIPLKYHSTQTSGLTATVAADKAVHDFDMRP